LLSRHLSGILTVHFQMKSRTLAILIFAVVQSLSASARITENFDNGWLFLKADATNAGQIQFDDSGWRKLNLPHDWSIEGPFAETNTMRGSGGFLPAGIGWYRKHFTLPQSDADKKVFVEFDGVMANSDVWINGFHLGHRPNGYVGLNYELTGHLNFGGDNILAVRCDNSVQPSSRFYCGAGIYRHVRLTTTDPIHIAQDGVFVTTEEIKSNTATIRVEMTITNQSDSVRHITVINYILAPGQKMSDADLDFIKPPWFGAPRAPEYQRLFNEPPSYATLAPGASETLADELVVTRPKLWNLDNPNLYRLVTRIVATSDFLNVNGFSTVKIMDEVITPFGIRDAHFDADTGFWLNGKNFKVKGACVHEDGGAFGMAVPISIWEARLKTLKTLGVNAIRTAHNPPAPEFLDLCDRMGLLVMDEMFDCWTIGKQGLDGVKLADYHLYFNDWSKIDTANIVRRDRNHPSIILYSAGNEIHDTTQPELAKGILSGLIEIFHANDPTRPVTQALFRPNVSHDYDDGLADLLDVIGQNYREQEILAAHRQKPSRKIIGTENTHTRQQWVAMRDNPPYAGQFIWTGVDYLGEARRWPLICHGSGLLDRTGAPRAVAFERQSWWIDQPMVFMVRRSAPTDAMPTDPGYAADEKYSQVLFADWTPKNSQPHGENVEVYSNCKTVELFLNGKSIGKKEINADASPRNWTVPFAPGILKAVARNEKGKIVATSELRTADRPAKIVLTTETKTLSPGFENIAIVRAKITDKDGIEIPNANDLVSFFISGAGEIIAADNANNLSHESFQANQRLAFHGECAAFVRATSASGKITLTASAPGLKSDSVILKAIK
jgi:beta-galactosidase